MKNFSKKFDLLVVAVLLAATASVWYFFNLKPLIGLSLYTLTPVIYLALRESKNYKKIFWALLIFGGLAGFAFDFIQYINSAWTTTRLIISWQLFNVWPIDDLIGYFVMTLLIVVFYEHFLDDEKNKRISKNLLWSLIIFGVIAVTVFFTYLINPGLLEIKNIYLFGGLVAIAFPVIFLFCKPKLLPKFLMTAAFFFFVWLAAEIMALKTGGWIFPGQYIGSVSIFDVAFPFEEAFFWMLFYAGSITAYYEFFIDDMK